MNLGKVGKIALIGLGLVLACAYVWSLVGDVVLWLAVGVGVGSGVSYSLVHYTFSMSSKRVHVIDVSNLTEQEISPSFIDKFEADKLVKQYHLKRIFHSSDGSGVIVLGDMGVPVGAHTIGYMEWLADVDVIKKIAVPLRNLVIDKISLSRRMGVITTILASAFADKYAEEVAPTANLKALREALNTEIMEVEKEVKEIESTEEESKSKSKQGKSTIGRASKREVHDENVGGVGRSPEQVEATDKGEVP